MAKDQRFTSSFPRSENAGAEAKTSVFLIEDNPGDVRLVREALRLHGVQCELITARDGERAIEIMQEIEASNMPCPQLAILDLNLPKKSGREVLRRLREGKQCRQIPVVILTSSDSPQDQAGVADFGVSRYIRKPSNLDEYMAIGKELKAILDLSGTPGQGNA